MKNEIEEKVPEYLRLIIEELSLKNITRVRFAKQANKIILLFDKKELSKTNQRIINIITMVYPNIVIAINDETRPFDYEELYENDTEKPNKKVRPFNIYEWTNLSENENKLTSDYFNDFRFTGIELDTEKISNKSMQFGVLLEFINALREQDVIGYEDMQVCDEDTVGRHEHYIKNNCPDKRCISLWVSYNEELIEYSNGLKLADDPYFNRVVTTLLNREQSDIEEQWVKLTLDRINKNVKEYLERRMQTDNDYSRKNSIEESRYNLGLAYDGEDR